MARDAYKWVSYKKSFGCQWVVLSGDGYILADGGWWWRHFTGGRRWWVVVDGGGSWNSLV